jgi:hypothetical protein
MKNLNAIRPKLQELNESLRKPEDILGLKSPRLMLEPKFDGSFVFITRDAKEDRLVVCTKDGNEVSLHAATQAEVAACFDDLSKTYIFEAELEPVPWSEENKVLLNGNLYSGKEMPFGIRVLLHDVIPVVEVGAPKSTAIQRYSILEKIAGISGSEEPIPVKRGEKLGVFITPCKMVTPDEAAQIFSRGWEQGKAAKRVMFGGKPYEGIVLINPDSIHLPGRSNKWKVKPFHTVDIEVTSLVSKDTGKVITYEVQGFDTKSGEKVRLFTGINKSQFEEMQKAKLEYEKLIIEVEALAIKSLQHGNPTFKSVRYDKMPLRSPLIEVA